MKSKILLVCLSLFALLAGCSSDDDNRSSQDPSLNGRWYLQSASCFCGFPEEPKFYENELVFDVASSKVTVKGGSVTSFIAAGTYDYVIEVNNVLVFKGVAYTYKINDRGELTMFSDPYPKMVDDEITLLYKSGERPE